VNKYEREQNVDFINDLVTMYITQMTPKLVELRQLLYPYTAVEKYDNTCVLIQRKMEIEKMEDDMATNPRGIIHFDVGDKVQLRPGAPRSQPQERIEQSSSSGEIEFDENDENTDE
jgi:hypothetical protein